MSARSRISTGNVIFATLAMAGLLGVAAPSAQAQTFSATSSGVDSQNPNKAQAVFTVLSNMGSGCTGSGSLTCLDVVLTNTSSYAAQYNNTDVLTSVFFNDGSNMASSNLTAVSAIASTTKWTGQGASTACGSGGCNVGDEYGYVFSASGFTAGSALNTSAQNGISAVGYSGATPSLSSGSNFDGGSGNTIGGLAGGLVGSNFSGPSGKGAYSVFQSSVDLKFSISNYNSSTFAIKKVSFGYGSVPEFSVPAPEPISLTVLGSALVSLAIVRRKARTSVSRTA